MVSAGNQSAVKYGLRSENTFGMARYRLVGCERWANRWGVAAKSRVELHDQSSQPPLRASP